VVVSVFFCRAEDGIRDFHVTGVQTCALPICGRRRERRRALRPSAGSPRDLWSGCQAWHLLPSDPTSYPLVALINASPIGLFPAGSGTRLPVHPRKEKPVGDVTETIDVDRDVRSVYNQWTQFEEFPRFMEGVDRVQQIDDRHLHWEVDIVGVDREFDAEITEQTPDQRIAWRSRTGVDQGGVVTFHPLNDEQTRVTLQLTFEPEGLVERAGDTLGLVAARVEGDLKRFKEFIESRGSETGAWRGEVDRDEPS